MVIQERSAAPGSCSSRTLNLIFLALLGTWNQVLGSSSPLATRAPLADQGVLVVAGILALIAGWTDWRTRRIPNWLTVAGALIGLFANAARGWQGVVYSLEGLGLGLVLLFPLVLVRGIGAGDWKLVGAIGAFLGPRNLLLVLAGAVLIAA